MPGGVREQVLDDALDAGRVDEGLHGCQVELHLAAPQLLHLRQDAADEGGNVGRFAVRLHDAPVEPVEVEQVGQQPVELPRARGDAVHELATLFRRELLLHAVKHLRGGEHGSDRPTEIVRHGA